MTYLIRATTPYEAKDYLPGLRYWNAALSMWDDYSEATGYDTDAPPLPPTGPRPASTIEVVAAYPLDAQGWPYTDSEIGPVRMTHCCGAATSANEDGFYCKSCYASTSSYYERPAAAPAALDADDARNTSTPLAAFADMDPTSLRHGCHYFADETALRAFIAEQSAADGDQKITVWDLDRHTGTWTARPAIHTAEETR